MTAPATACLLLTCDSQLPLHMARAVGEGLDIRVTSSRQEWAHEPSVAALRMLDLRHPEAGGALSDMAPETLGEIVALGVPESDPFIACRDAGVFAVEPLDVPAERLRQTLRQALMVHQAQEGLSLLRQQRAVSSMPGPSPVEQPELNLAPLYELWRASRHFHDIQKLLDQLVEGVASAGRIARVGVFARLRNETVYRLWAGLRCLDKTGSLSFDQADPFVRWLECHAHLACRAHLAHVEDLRTRRLLQGVLDESGAEIIVPLLGKRGLLGWIFVGHRATGIPFAPRDLFDLTVIGEQVATLLENALLVEELAVQKTLAENLLAAIPVGILAVSEDGVVRWFNREAEQILGVTAAETVSRPVELAGSRIADVVLRTIHDGAVPEPVAWTDAFSRRTIRADAHRIGGEGASLGAMLLLSDISRERLLREKQEELERHAFWNDLAAAMSHEVRNPLVAISTFAQLLPERYTDPEFRQQFFSIVTGEVTRLNAIITQINAFAHPRRPVCQSVTPALLVSQVCQRAAQLAGVDKIAVTCESGGDLPSIIADGDALAEGLAHVLVNAHEAVNGCPTAQIGLYVRCLESERRGVLMFAISDNGRGIDESIRDRLFSPFCTTKARGLGLGLPLARRAVVDHGGGIDIETNSNGTTVTITVPVKGRTDHAETVDC